jgi:hypothetical protein
MPRSFRIGKIAGLQVSFTPSALVSSLFLWTVLAFVAHRLLGTSLIQAGLGGLLAVMLHWLSDLVHHIGHAWAARRTGYPMQGVRLWLLLGTSLYPRDEIELPAMIHIRRAWGGPVASLGMTLIGLLFVLLTRQSEALIRWLALFFFLDNLFVFTLGALIPMGFTDGSTLLEWRNRE